MFFQDLYHETRKFHHLEHRGDFLTFADSALLYMMLGHVCALWFQDWSTKRQDEAHSTLFQALKLMIFMQA